MRRSARVSDPWPTAFRCEWRLAYSAARPATAIFVSQHQHCLLDLLYRHAIGELRCRIPLIVGNHSTAAASWPVSTVSRSTRARGCGQQGAGGAEPNWRCWKSMESS